MDWFEKPKDIQGSAAWHEWRMTGIGASEAAVIMDCSPWMGPVELFKIKTGKKLPQDAGFAAARGTRLEPIARAKFNQAIGSEFLPQTFESEIGFLNASLDGYNATLNQAVEIKCLGKENHLLAKDHQQIPEYYMWQIQQQYFCSNAKTIFYCSYFLDKDQDDNDGEIVFFPVERDDLMIETYLKQAKSFWDCVQNDREPPLGKKEYLETDDATLKSLAEKFDQTKNEMTILELRSELIKKAIIEHVEHNNWERVKCGPIKVSKQTRKGNISWKDVPVPDGVDPEKFRGPDSTFWKVEAGK